MQLTGPGHWGHPTHPDDAITVLRAAVDAGVTHIDTADAYGPGVAEDLIRHALHPYPDDLVVATKGGMTRHGPNIWATNGHPDHLRASLDASLRRLGTDHIRLYYLHRIDPTIALEDQLGVLQDAQTAGKIGHIGLSTVTVEQLLTATTLARISAVSNRYNILDHTNDDVLRCCELNTITFVPFAPLAAGRVHHHPGLADIATACDTTPTQLALAWLLHRSPAILPIPGTTNTQHLYENLEALHINLNRNTLHHITLATTPPDPWATTGATSASGDGDGAVAGKGTELGGARVALHAVR